MIRFIKKYILKKRKRLTDCINIIDRIETIDGSAIAGEDFVAIDEVLTFEANEIEKQVSNIRFKN